MPLHRRVPKRGFVNLFRKEYAVVNVGALSVFPPESTVDPEALMARRLIKKSMRRAVKILGEGELDHRLTVRAHAFSQSALAKIQAAGGQGEVL
jgi:large subunit ribosomal protein L15